MLAVLLPTRRHYLAAFLLGFLLVLLGAASCRPHPKPPAPGDSTAVDTAGQGVADDTVPELTPGDTLVGPTVSLRSAGAATGGLAFGLSQWPSGMWCTGPFTATMAGTTPALLGGSLRAAQRCGLGMMVVWPRRLMTTNGETVGRYSPDKAKQLCDDYLKAFPADSMTKYATNGTLLGMSAGDDFSDDASWGGTAVTATVAATAQSYCRGKMPAAVPLGMRQTPAYISGSAELARTVDFGWLQYLTRRPGTPTGWYSKGADIAAKYGFRVVMGVNVHSCHAAGADDPCSPQELRNFLGAALAHPANCGSLSWRYDESDYRDAGRRAAYADLAQTAKGTAARSCHR